MTATPEPFDLDDDRISTDVPPGQPAQPPEPSPEVAALTAQLEEARAQASAAKDAQLRALAEVDNVRKRAEREIAAGSKFGVEKILGELLAVTDSLELGLAAAAQPDVQIKTVAEGMELTRKQLVSVLEKHGVSQIDPKGQPFNPDLHEAVSMVPSADVAPNHVLNVMQKGYKLHERLLRPAMVVVARAP